MRLSRIVLLLQHSFNGLYSRTTWVIRYQKSKISLDLNEARDDGVWGWQWHQMDDMQTICTSLQTDNHTSTPSLNIFTGRMLFAYAQPIANYSISISFEYASPRLWNQLPASVRHPCNNISISDSASPMSGTSSIGSIHSPLSSSVTPSLFHSRLKTFLFCKSFPP